MSPSIACYLRVSSRTQKTDSQKVEIEQWLIRHGHDPSTVQWFEDKETGKTLKRLDFEGLQTTIFDGNIKTVVVWNLDRISRRLKDGINTLASWCERGVQMVSVTQQIDLNGVIGSMLAGVMFGLAEIDWSTVENDNLLELGLHVSVGFIKDDSVARPKQSLRGQGNCAIEG